MRPLTQLWILATLLFPFSAHALTTSEHALRVEDKREGNVLLGAESAEIAAGEVYGTIVLLWGNLEIHGQVKEVVVLSGKVTFFPDAKLTKSLVVMGGSFESKDGAQVAPQDVIFRSPGLLWRILSSAGNIWRDNFTWVAKLVGALLTCLILWAIGLVLFYLSPSLQGMLTAKLLSGKNFLVGWLGAIFAPIFLLMLVVSLLGILVVPLYALLLVLAALISYLGAALWAGHRLLPAKAGQRINPKGFLLGLAAMQFLWSLGFWGILPVLFLWTLAWGALLRGARRLWR